MLVGQLTGQNVEKISQDVRRGGEEEHFGEWVFFGWLYLGKTLLGSQDIPFYNDICDLLIEIKEISPFWHNSVITLCVWEHVWKNLKIHKSQLQNNLFNCKWIFWIYVCGALSLVLRCWIRRICSRWLWGAVEPLTKASLGKLDASERVTKI